MYLNLFWRLKIIHCSLLWSILTPDACKIITLYWYNKRSAVLVVSSLCCHTGLVASFLFLCLYYIVSFLMPIFLCCWSWISTMRKKRCHQGISKNIAKVRKWWWWCYLYVVIQALLHFVCFFVYLVSCLMPISLCCWSWFSTMRKKCCHQGECQ